MAVSLLPSCAAQLISREKLLSRASRAATWKQLRSGRAGGVIHPLAHTNMCRVCAGALGGNNWRCDVTGLRWTSGASQATQQHLDALGGPRAKQHAPLPSAAPMPASLRRRRQDCESLVCPRILLPND